MLPGRYLRNLKSDNLERTLQEQGLLFQGRLQFSAPASQSSRQRLPGQRAFQIELDYLVAILIAKSRRWLFVFTFSKSSLAP
jgi:hypothetical protein